MDTSVTSMKDKLKHRPKCRFLHFPVDDFDNSVTYILVWIENIPFDEWEFARFLNRGGKAEGYRLYRIPNCHTFINKKLYMLYVFKQLWG